ncbi:hypothetical protein ADICEAN_02640 [Cesiribacter andamanensis AMV16]|uniref:Uncharacterized protein n=1 Tax=Cesiribacter andamanensis AMV16 TaxID=1279009 RepID=M7NKE9_9BACT|nr:hypothetical protein ADICEAN_02640 [Cesiribacter andamanensis AMV16]
MLRIIKRSGGVMNQEYFHSVGVFYLINDSIISFNELSDRSIPLFRNNAAQLRHFFQNADAIEKSLDNC